MIPGQEVHLVRMAMRHDCFIVFHPADREPAARFVDRFRDVFIARARGIRDEDGLEADGNTDPAVLLHQVRRKYVWEAALTIVLTGSCTWARRYVDWEIAAALRDDAEIGERTGLLGIRLPGLPASRPAIVPERFADNVDAGYATFRPYPASSEELRAWVESALVDRQYRTPDNRRPLRLADDHCPHERIDA
jgi:hypothetical protein